MDGATPLPVVNRALLADAVEGLSAPRKALPPKWLYDAHGSALFERITTLSEYYPTRTETGILRDHADRLATLVPPGGALVELGSGASVKTRLLLDRGDHFGAYVPVDISADFLAATAVDLGRMYPRLSIRPVAADFTAPVALPTDMAPLPKIGFFPGSTIGNLEPAVAQRLLQGVAGWPGVCGLVLGADLVKDDATLLVAYDDAEGVTAEFIANILRRLNTEAGADFDLDAFDYRATWNAEAARIEMDLVSRRNQSVGLAGTAVRFQAGEAIHVSAARKYTPDTLTALAAAGGWTMGALLTDPAAQFAVALLEPAG